MRFATASIVLTLTAALATGAVGAEPPLPTKHKLLQDIAGHAQALRAYAWSSPIEGSENRRFHAVLHLGGIKSPTDAVRAAIVAEARAK
jgi:hypothetical protein